MIGIVPIFRCLMGALTLPKAARLSRRAEFAAVRGEGRSWHGRLMVLGALATPGREPARIGIVTSRRTGTAVERSKVRRRLREIFRLHRRGLPAGLWMVVVPRRAAVGAEYAALAEEWCTLAQRGGILPGREP
ncbi:MAG: ribonuclease P protein component [Chthoniobacterales bacterium]